MLRFYFTVSTDKGTKVLARDLSKSKKWGKAYYAGNMRVYLPLGANSLSATGTLLISQRDILLYDNNEELVGSTEI